MSRKQLKEQMDAKEVTKWMAYEHSINPDHYDRLIKDVTLEIQQEQSAEEEARAIRNFLNSLKGS